MLTSPEGEVNVIDVQELGLQEKRALLERLVKTAEENNEKFLLKLKGRIDRLEFHSRFIFLILMKVSLIEML